MKVYYRKYFLKSIYIFLLITPLFKPNSDFLYAEDSYLNLQELQFGSTTKGDDNSELPNNPFEIVEMMRRINSLNNATKPSDALDDALESFNILEGNTIDKEEKI